jgi:hypothetical protein
MPLGSVEMQLPVVWWPGFPYHRPPPVHHPIGGQTGMHPFHEVLNTAYILVINAISKVAFTL